MQVVRSYYRVFEPIFLENIKSESTICAHKVVDVSTVDMCSEENNVSMP